MIWRNSLAMKNPTWQSMCLLAGLLLSSCASLDSRPTKSTVAELVSGQALFGEEIAPAPAVDVLAMNDEMRTWVGLKTELLPSGRSRLRRLLQGMVDDGLLSLEYDLNLSLTAEQTFARHQGNCLSFSILFVALAREAGLKVEFQMVEIPPSFTNEGELVLLNNHINVQVTGIRHNVNFFQKHVVDFNVAEYDGNYATQKVSDDYALSLYHGNIAVEALQRRDYREAFRQLKRGIEISPDVAGLWVNLGVVYSRNAQLTMAENSYRQALAIEPRNKSALVNLINVNRHLGKLEEAENYQRRVQRYLRSNPYYHQHLAMMALDDDLVDEALRHVNRAIALKDDEHQFYHLEGLVHYRAGRVELAERSFMNAERVAHRADLRKTYARKLGTLKDDSD